MDLIGPLKQSQSGNQYIVVFTEYLTKWAEAKSIPDKSALTIFTAIGEHIISRFGAPEKIISDQGREFVNQINNELFQKLEIKHSICSAYHPQSNGLTERFNQTLIRHLRKLVNENHDNWDTLISWVLMSYRANRQSTTKLSPFYLVYGTMIRLPIELDSAIYKSSDGSKDVQDESLDHRIKKIQNFNYFRLNAKSNINSAQEKQKEQYDSKHQAPRYQVGDLVWYKNSRRETRKGGKLESTWTDKKLIEQVLDKGTYRLEGIKRIFNAIQLKRVRSENNEDIDKSPAKKNMLELNSSNAKSEITYITLKHLFIPPSAKWQKEICGSSGGRLMYIKKSGPTYCVVNKEFSTFTSPTRIMHITGDGNCLFRAFSYVITGEECQHHAVRQLICDFIECKQRNFDGINPSTYLTKNKMRTNATWGTTEEIFACAGWLNTTIYTWNAFGERLCWNKHSTNKNVNSEFGIYLDNSSGIHFNVVLSIGKK